MNKHDYIAYLKNLINDDDDLKFTSYKESIYVIDDLWIGGGFYKGRRSVDHFVLLDKFILSSGVNWADILNWGVVIIPESQSYISDDPHPILGEQMHYLRLPLNNNQIVGFKDSQTGIDL